MASTRERARWACSQLVVAAALGRHRAQGEHVAGGRGDWDVVSGGADMEGGVGGLGPRASQGLRLRGVQPGVRRLWGRLRRPPMGHRSRRPPLWA